MTVSGLGIQRLRRHRPRRPATSRSSTRTSRSSSSRTARSTTTGSSASRLIGAGHRFATQSDTEVIVHLYEDHGRRLRASTCAGCSRSRSGTGSGARLLLARDRVGKKPLFYARRDGTIWFGSEPKAILQDPEVDREVESRRDRLATSTSSTSRIRSAPSPRSRSCRRRTRSSGDDGRVEVERYWRLSYAPHRRLPLARGGARADPRQAARGDALAAAERRAARRVPLRRGRLERGRGGDGAAVSRAGEDLLDRLRRRRATTRPRMRARVADALRHGSPRAARRARTRSSCSRGSSGITASRSPTARRSRASTWRS